MFRQQALDHSNPKLSPNHSASPMLLFWSRDAAQGRKIAAVKFDSLVKIDAIRIVPAGIAPFAAVPEEVGETNPSLFELKVLFNSQFDDPNDKSRAPNSLVEMTMDYDGTMRDFPVAMDNFSTRLVIFEGSFAALSVAIYGYAVGSQDVAPQIPAPMVIDYQPVDLPSLPEPRKLPPNLDPARMSAPTEVAAQLIWEEYPELRLDSVVRHLLAEADFHSCRAVNNHSTPEDVSRSLAQCVNDYDTDIEDWLDDAVRLARSPFLASIPADVDQFVDRLHQALGTEAFLRTDFQRQCFFELLESMAIQPDYVVLNFLNPGILSTFMEGPYLELVDLEHLHSSMFNPHIAHALREDVAAMDLLHSMIQNSHLPTSIRETAARNVKLVNGWAVAENLLSASPSVDEHLVFEHETFVTWLLEFVTWPSAFAPFLLNVLPLVSERRTDSRIQPVPTGGVLSEEQCLTMLRACQGISSVVIVTCRALLDCKFALAHRTLAILNMLRTHDYAEVVGLVLRHPFVRPYLTAVTHSQAAPSDLVDLYDRIISQSPHAIPPSYTNISVDHALPQIDDLQILSQYQAMVEDFCPDPPTLHSIRCALAAYLRHVGAGRGPPHDAVGLLHPILHVTAGLAGIMRRLAAPADSDVQSLPHAILLDSAGLGMDAIRSSLPYFSLSRRSRMDIVQTSISAYLCAQLTPETPFDEAQPIRQKAAALLRALLDLHHQDSSLAEGHLVVRYILTYQISHPIISLDVPTHLFDLLQAVTKSDSHEGDKLWPRYLAASIRELDTLLAMMPIPNRLNAMQFLDKFDKDGIGLTTELIALHSQRLEEATNLVNGGTIGQARYHFLQRHIEDGCSFLSLFITAPGGSRWAFESSQVADHLASAIFGLLHANLLFDSLSKLVQAFDPARIQLHPDLAAACAVLLLRESHVQSGLNIAPAYQRCHALLTIGDVPPNVVQQVVTELGRSLARFVSDEAGRRQLSDHDEVDLAEAGISLLLWAAGAASWEEELVPLYGLSRSGFDTLCDIFEPSLPTERRNGLRELGGRFMYVTEEETEVHRSFARPSTDEEQSFSYEELLFACHGYTSGTGSPFDERPTTPLGATIGAVVALMSPPILRSPSITGPTLHKKYSAQDFRLARLSPTNTSRPPSTHVDAFDNATLSPHALPMSPILATGALSPISGLQSPVMTYHPI